MEAAILIWLGVALFLLVSAIDVWWPTFPPIEEQDNE